MNLQIKSCYEKRNNAIIMNTNINYLLSFRYFRKFSACIIHTAGIPLSPTTSPTGTNPLRLPRYRRRATSREEENIP